MAVEDSRARLRLWLRLLATTNELERIMRRRMRAQFGTTLPRFDVMAALDRAPDGLSMSELSRHLMVTNGNTTTLITAMERDGLVQRTVSPSDRRSFSVALTAAGRASFEEIAAAHARWVAELLAGVEVAEVERLSNGLHEVRLAIRESAGEPLLAAGVR
jgi:DNA-binding MarR family transcriptional regulator